MATVTYQHALRQGQKEFKLYQAQNRDPYLPALEQIIPKLTSLTEVSLGTLGVSMDQIAGTRSTSRREAFSHSFYPLLEEKSEFATKWSALASIHLSEGIRDPILAVEYLNRFYVVEGHKRVSVLRFFDAPTVQATVTRLLPKRTEEKENQVYYEFLDFYQQTHVNYIQFHDYGKYKKLLRLLGADEGGAWDLEQQRNFSAYCTRFRQALQDTVAYDQVDRDEALLRYLQIYGYDHLQNRTQAQLKSDLTAILAELKSEVTDAPPALLTELESSQKPKNFITQIIRPKVHSLKVAFLHDKTATSSYWTFTHEQGRLHVQEVFQDRVETASFFNVLQEDVLGRIRALAAQEYGMIFTTTPRLLGAALKAAAEFPGIKFLNCSLNISHPILRTYYGRMYEAKFLSGLVAGALSENGRIGYIGDYPIYGMPACVNAFALGAQMANPRAHVFLEWSTMPYVDMERQFRWYQVTAISGQDMYLPNRPKQTTGLYLLNYERPKSVARSLWHWGKFYEKIIRSVLDGSWSDLDSTAETGQAINYWWGLASGVIDMVYAPGIPPQTRRLVELVRANIINGTFRPLEGPVYDNNGRLRIHQGEILTPSDIVKIDWLASNVAGSIPPIELLTPEAQALVKVQGVWKRMDDDVP